MLFVNPPHWYTTTSTKTIKTVAPVGVDTMDKKKPFGTTFRSTSNSDVQEAQRCRVRENRKIEKKKKQDRIKVST